MNDPRYVKFKSTFEPFSVPLEVQEALWNYFMYGYEPGGFTTAVLRNDFASAITRAHPSLTSENLRDIARWFFNVRLPDAFGTQEKIDAWRSLTNEQRQEIMEDHRLCATVFDILRGVPGP